MNLSFGTILILGGITLIVFGIALNLNLSFPFFGNLPGDIKVKGENFSFYFPITTSLLLSLILSLLFYFLNK